MSPPQPSRPAQLPAGALAAGAAALAALVPFLSGLVAGQSLYFRDLSLYFFPLRRFIAEGMRHGELRWWNPYIHEGEPLALPALGYPLDLLHALWPAEWFFSLLLALHLPLGALGAFALARALGAGRAGAFAAGAVYGLGGFAASTVNLYVYAQALGWAPLAVLGLLKASGGGPPRAIALGALPVALCFSTTGLELALQAVVAALVLCPRPRRVPALAAAAGLGMMLASLPLLVVSGTVAGSVRDRGFTTDVVLAHSVHPLTLVQTVVASLHGDTARLAERWWGQNFFPRGFPYVLSLYLGAGVVALALVGARQGGTNGRRLALLAAGATLVCLGRWIGWGALLEHAPALRVVRYPVKAFFSVHLAAALLAGLGLDALRRGPPRVWRALAVAAGALAAPLLLLPLLPSLAPGFMRWFAGGFFPPGMDWPRREAHLRFVLGDGAAGGAAGAAVALVALLVARGRLAPRVGSLSVAAVVVADLVRAGAGLNPHVPAAALRPSAEAEELAAAIRAGGGRAFTCDVTSSPAYLAARAARGERHVVWTLWSLSDTLTPAMNVAHAVPTAYSADLTMLVPRARVLDEAEGCASIGPLLPRLRAAGVTHVVSADPLAHPALAAQPELAPSRLAPLRIHVYRLASPLPRVSVRADDGRPLAAPWMRETPGRMEVRVEADRAAALVLRDAYAPGWTASVNGRPAEIEVEEGRYRAVRVAAGRSDVTFRYRPPRLTAGMALSAAAALSLAALWRRQSGGAPPPADP
jgi:hypothetical protein